MSTKRSGKCALDVRAVVDTNVWVSAVLTPFGRAAAVFAAFRERRFTAITSQSLMRELQNVLASAGW